MAVEEIGADFELISKLESKTELILYRKSRCAVETKLDSRIENDRIPCGDGQTRSLPLDSTRVHQPNTELILLLACGGSFHDGCCCMIGLIVVKL